jgi:hypothetical protein
MTTPAMLRSIAVGRRAVFALRAAMPVIVAAVRPDFARVVKYKTPPNNGLKPRQIPVRNHYE